MCIISIAFISYISNSTDMNPTKKALFQSVVIICTDGESQGGDEYFEKLCIESVCHNRFFGSP